MNIKIVLSEGEKSAVFVADELLSAMQAANGTINEYAYYANQDSRYGEIQRLIESVLMDVFENNREAVDRLMDLVLGNGDTVSWNIEHNSHLILPLITH